MTTKPNPYAALFLSADCTQEAIKKAYRELAKMFHPDNCSISVQKEAFASIQNAYDLIGTAENRRAYDLASSAIGSTRASSSGTTPQPSRGRYTPPRDYSSSQSGSRERRRPHENANARPRETRTDAPFAWHKDGYRHRPKSMDSEFKAESLFMKIKMTASQFAEFEAKLRSYTTDPLTNYAFGHFFVKQPTRSFSNVCSYAYAFLGTQDELQTIRNAAWHFGIIEKADSKAEQFKQEFAV